MGLPAIAMIGAAGLGAVGQIQQSQASSAAAGYNAKIAADNAQIATQEGQWAGAEGEQQAGLAGLKNQQQEGAIKTAQAANNVDVNTGSAKDVQRSQAEMGMLNEMNIRSNAARQAYGFATQSASDTAQSQLDRTQQSADKTGGYLSAAGSLLGGAGQASMYSNWLGSRGLGTQESVDTANLPAGQYGPVYEG